MRHDISGFIYFFSLDNRWTFDSVNPDVGKNLKPTS
jgi:hypothetical protein